MKYLFAALRIFVGVIFVVSGSEKLLGPYENFLYVIQAYQVLPIAEMERLAAFFFPWVELILGCFLVLGLWLRQTLIGVWLCFLLFIVLVGQAQIRGLPISECGCFGDLVKFPLEVTMTVDSVLLLIVSLLVYSLSKTGTLSLDRYFEKSD